MRYVALFLLVLAGLLPERGQSQPFTNTVLQPNFEFQWGSLQVPGGYVTIGNTDSYSPTVLKAEFCRFGAAGNLTVPVQVYTPANNGEIQAIDIENAPAVGGLPVGYYITGFYVPATGQSNMFVMRVTAAGLVLWARRLASPYSNNQDKGVAVVTMPNGDVVAVGCINNKWVYAARFAPGGGVIWGNTYSGCGTSVFNQYGNVQTPSPFAGSSCQLIPKEACLDLGGGSGLPNSNDPSVAITGVMIDPNNIQNGPLGQAFVMNFSGTTGLEFWRNIYPAYQGSTGYDILQDPGGAFTYTIGGSATQNGETFIYAFHTNPFGLQLWKQALRSVTAPSNVYARALMPGQNATDYILAGPDFNGTTTTAPATFAVELLAAGTAVGFQNLYPPSGTPVLGAESLSRGVANPYVIATVDNAFPPDLHLTGINLLGNTDPGCTPAVPLNYPLLNPPIDMKYVERQYTPDQIWPTTTITAAPQSPTENFCPQPPANCSVTANFSFASAGPPCGRVQFTNTSVVNCPGGTVIYDWTFGDGGVSNVQNPVHDFSAGCSSTFNVCLTVKCLGPNGIFCAGNTICQNVTVHCCAVEPAFCYTVENGTVTFTNQSGGCGNLSYLWTFWDGTTSTAAAPVKLYDPSKDFGVKQVCLKVISSEGCSKTCCKDISLPPVDYCAEWTPDFDYCLTENTQLALTNSSGAPPAGVVELFEWTDNGASFSDSENPDVRTLEPGVHTICLTITRKNNGLICSKNVCKTITIAAPCAVDAGFAYRICTGSPFTVDFTDQSTGATSWLWDFGDGATSAAQNPSHVYASGGTYVVCLTVNAGSNCASKFCFPVQVSGTFACTVATLAPGPDSVVPESLIEFSPTEQGLVKQTEYPAVTPHFDLVPNPAGNRLFVRSSQAFEPGTRLQITDLQGKRVLASSVDDVSAEQAFDLSALPEGLYLVFILPPQGSGVCLKFVKD